MNHLGLLMPFNFFKLLGSVFIRALCFQEGSPAKTVLSKKGNLLVLMIRMWQ